MAQFAAGIAGEQLDEVRGTETSEAQAVGNHLREVIAEMLLPRLRALDVQVHLVEARVLSHAAALARLEACVSAYGGVLQTPPPTAKRTLGSDGA